MSVCVSAYVNEEERDVRGLLMMPILIVGLLCYWIREA